jgi:hypothetical protein
MDVNTNLYNSFNSVKFKMQETAKEISKGHNLTDNLVELRNQDLQSKAIIKAMESEKVRLGGFLDIMA